MGGAYRGTVVLLPENLARLPGIAEQHVQTDYININFLTSELRKHRDTARANAIKAARHKATDLTAALGQQIGRAYSISEHGSGAHPISRAAMMTKNSSQSFSGANAGGGFAAGQIAITANVSVSFLIDRHRTTRAAVHMPARRQKPISDSPPSSTTPRASHN